MTLQTGKLDPRDTLSTKERENAALDLLDLLDMMNEAHNAGKVFYVYLNNLEAMRRAYTALTNEWVSLR